MERKIGEIFEYKGEWYQCVEGRCKDCHFSEKRYLCKQFIVKNFCLSGIIFKKLEKVGESYMNNEKIVQKYKIYHDPLIAKDGVVERYVPGLIDIVIKQNKEDMEEKKQCGDNRFRAIARAKEHLFQATNIAEDKKELKVLDSFLLRCWQMGWLKQYEDAEEKKLNLKPFDIQKAREGKPVCTRDGRKARIICFDRRGDKFPIVALLDGCNKKHSEVAVTFTNEGLFEIGEKSSNDLMMLPEKKEGWINIIKTEDGVYCCKGELHSDYNDAFIENINVLDNRGITVKIEWEE